MPATRDIIPVRQNVPKTVGDYRQQMPDETPFRPAFSAESQLGSSVVQSISMSDQLLVKAMLKDQSAMCMNVTMFAASTRSDGSAIPVDTILTGVVEFGQGGVQSERVSVAVGNGISFSVPGSQVQVKSKIIGASPGDPGIFVGAFASLLPYPRSGGSVPLLAAVVPRTTLVPADQFAVTVPPFASAFKLQSSNFLGDQLDITFTTGAASYHYRKLPMVEMPWIPLWPTVETIVIANTGAADVDYIFPMIALEF